MKKILCLLLALILSLGFAACGDGKTPVGGDYDFDVPLDYAGEITVWIQSYDYERKMMDVFKENFNRRYKNIQVNVEEITPAQYRNMLQKASSLSSEMPDVFWVSPQFIGKYNDLDILMPLNALEESDESFSFDNLVEESLACCRQNGETWIMPRDFNQVVLYYNKDMFDAAGCEYPSATEAMSRAEFETLMADLQAGLKKSDRKNSYGEVYKDCVVSAWDATMTWDSIIWPLFKSYGAEIIREDGTYQNADGSALFDSEASLNALDWVMEMTQKKYIEAEQATHVDGIDFKLERSPMYSHMRCNMNDLITPNGQYKGLKNIGIAPFPDLGDQDSYYVGSGCTGYSLYKYSKNVVPAWLFLRSIVSEQTQEALSQTGYATPVNQLLLDDPNANWIKYTNEKIGEGYTEPFIYKKSEAYSHVNEFLSKIGIAAQDSVYQDMSTLYCLVTDNCSTREGAQEYLTSYANRIRQSIESGLK